MSHRTQTRQLPNRTPSPTSLVYVRHVRPRIHPLAIGEEIINWGGSPPWHPTSGHRPEGPGNGSKGHGGCLQQLRWRWRPRGRGWGRRGRPDRHALPGPTHSVGKAAANGEADGHAREGGQR